MVGNHLTLADTTLFVILESLKLIKYDFSKKFPSLWTWMEGMRKIPGVAGSHENFYRRVSEFRRNLETDPGVSLCSLRDKPVRAPEMHPVDRSPVDMDLSSPRVRPLSAPSLQTVAHHVPVPVDPSQSLVFSNALPLPIIANNLMDFGVAPGGIDSMKFASLSFGLPDVANPKQPVQSWPSTAKSGSGDSMS